MRRDDRSVAAAVTWSSNRPEVATVTSSGIVAAVSAGRQRSRRRAKGGAETRRSSWRRRRSTAWRSRRTTATVDVGGSFRLTATVYDSRGNVIPGRIWRGRAATRGIATVDNTGRVAGVKVGSVIITATSGSKAGTATVSVKKN
jgi:uncharacterized protein YjdB